MNVWLSTAVYAVLLGGGFYLLVQIGLFAWDTVYALRDSVRNSVRFALRSLCAGRLRPPGWSGVLRGQSLPAIATTVLVTLILGATVGLWAFPIQTAAGVVPAVPSEDLVFVFAGGLFGYANPDGGVVIRPRYEGVKHFSEGLAAVCENGRWGYIDSRGRTVLSFDYLQANPFRNGTAIVATVDGSFAEIDKEGRLLRPMDTPSQKYVENEVSRNCQAKDRAAAQSARPTP